LQRPLTVDHARDVAPHQDPSEKTVLYRPEHLTGHGSFEHEGRGNTIMTQRSDESDAAWQLENQLFDQSLTLRCPPVAALKSCFQ
jgi:hypothetical protein